MDERIVQNRIASALDEPAAPEALVARTIVRARAIVAGREAEKSLAQSPLEEKKLRFAAQSVIGRLMLVKDAPEGASAEGMCEQLMREPAFRRAADRPAGELSRALQSGALLKDYVRLRSQKAPTAPQKPTPQKGGAVLM